MDADANARSLGRVFADDICYSVPDYQRRYVWSDEQADELWNDLMSVYMANPSDRNVAYMLGAIVVLKKNPRRADIVDGQQRLVTLTLMFCAIRGALNEVNTVTNIDLKKSVIQKVERKRSNCEYIKLHNTDDNDVLRKIVQGRIVKKEKLRSKSQKAINNNYQMFLTRAREFCENCGLTKDGGASGLWKINEIIQDLKDKIYFVYVKIDDEDQAYQVFQTLNSKGEALNQADLIKSYIVRHSRNSEDIQQHWNNMFKDVKNPDNLIYESLLSRSIGTKDIQKRELYRNAKMKCTTQEEITTYLDHLKEDVDIIKCLNDPELLKRETMRNRNNLVHLFYDLNKINAKYFRRPLITACREWGPDDSRTVELTDCLLKFFFMHRIISDRGIDLLRRIARTITKQILDGNDLGEIFWTILKDDTSEQTRDTVNTEPFLEKFKHFTLDLKTPLAHYILASLEFRLQPEGTHIRDYLYELQVEHIFPIRPKIIDWPNLNDLEGHLHNLGNLTLVTKDWNKSFQNSSFKKKKYGDENENSDPSKRKSYMNSEAFITMKYIKEYGQWTVKEIDDRADKLTQEALSIWDLSDYVSRAKKPQVS